MLRRAEMMEVPRLLECFWPVAQDLTRSGYPTYTDGIKTFADFSQQVLRALTEEWGEVLIWRTDDGEKGLLVIDEVDEEHVSLPVCLCKGVQHVFLTEAFAYVRGRHPGKILWWGFAPENAELLRFVREQDFELLDDTANWNIDLTRADAGASEAVPVMAENEAYFRSLWTDETMYWNADRILSDPSKWLLYVTKGGAVACMAEDAMLEIFGFQYRSGFNGEAFQALMQAVLLGGKARQARYLTCFADAAESELLRPLGFRRVSEYLCYQKKL